MILLIPRIQILQFLHFLLHNFVGLLRQIELLKLQKELIDFVHIIIIIHAKFVVALLALILFEWNDLIIIVIIVLNLFEDVPDGVSALLLVESIVRISPLHKLMHPLHLFHKYLLELLKPLFKAVDLEHLLSLFSIFVSDDKGNQEKKENWLVARLVNVNRMVHENAALRLGERGVHLNEFKTIFLELFQPFISRFTFWQLIILFLIVQK